MSLYLKYRPIDFDNLEGQSFIKNTLRNAIAQDKTVGAYLFCGPRGTGKTSTARLFAKTLNCVNQKDGNPCLKCDICKNFLEERLVDIIEIDAASYTGVDNIREIIEKAQFRPTQTKYKVYIIDEVHMLSKGAFNALLKILEEPPEFVKFILATTETHKVPETILSRCQRYDFKRIGEVDIKKRLEFIAKEENIKIDEKSINYIVKNAGGGLRNAISLFEQLIINNEIIYENVIENLGIVNEEILDNVLDMLLSNDINVISYLENLIENGKDIKLFFKELIFFIKEKILVNIEKKVDYLQLFKILEQLTKTYSETKNTIDENTTFIIGLLKIINNDFSNNNKEVIKKAILKQDKTLKPRIEEKNEIKSEITNENKKEICNNDVFDVFGIETSKNGNDSLKNEINEIKTDSDKKTSNFNKDELINNLKELKAKGGLTMGLRGADLSINGNNFYIKIKTQFAITSMKNDENIVLIKQGLEKMGFIDFNVIFTL